MKSKKAFARENNISARRNIEKPTEKNPQASETRNRIASNLI